MKYLYGTELVGYIKERQAKQVRSLKQSLGVNPKLVILYDMDDPAIETYMRLKRRYGEDIGVEVEAVKSTDLASDIARLNEDSTVHAVIIQLPIQDNANAQAVLDQVSLAKDVDGLAVGSEFDQATPKAILWLLAGHNIEPFGKNVHVIGRGKLVGAPLVAMLRSSGIEPTVHTSQTGPINLEGAELVVSATGHPGLLTSDMIPQDCIVLDAGTASDKGKMVGDLADDVYERDDLQVTPRKGGIGPLTVCSLFENVLLAARNQAASESI